MTKFFLTLAIILLVTGRADASLKEDVKKGNILYNKKIYADAAKFYEEALAKETKNGIASFDLGAAKYKEGSYLGAIEKFNTAIASGQPKLIQASDYNIGNTEYVIGKLKEEGSFDEAKERYETALKFYKRAMDLDPGDKDAKLNYEFVEKKLNELAKKYQFKKNEKQNDDKKDQNQKQDKHQQDENKDKENKDQSNGQGGQQQKDEKDKGKEGEGEEGKNRPEEGKGKPEEGRDKQGEGEAGGENQKEESKNKPRDGEETPAPKEENEAGEGQQQGEKPDGGLAAYQTPEPQEGREMSEQEAKMMLEGYKGEEATGRAVRMRKRVIDLPEPAKDW